MAVKTNRQILSRGSDIYARKKFKTHGVDEVSFDRSARAYVQLLPTWENQVLLTFSFFFLFLFFLLQWVPDRLS